MGDVINKTKFFIFLGIICLLINLCACCVAYMQSEQNINEYISQNPDYIISGDIPPNNNVTISNFALSSGTSFVPFFSIISLLFLGLDTMTMLFIGIIIAIIGALQLFIIITIVLNMLPFFNV